MPELMDYSIMFGALAAILSRIIPKFGKTPYRMPIWGTLVIGVLGAYLGPPAFDLIQNLLRAVPFLPEITGGMIFVGLFVVFVLLSFDAKGQKRRVPIWAVLLIAVGAAFGLPSVVYKLTGAHSRIALRSDVNHCTQDMLGQVQPRSVTNVCDYEIVVGMCLEGEENPTPCRQSIKISPRAVGQFDPSGESLSSAPGNRNGLTVIACRAPNRPSRMLNQTGKRFEGVCLPGA